MTTSRSRMKSYPSALINNVGNMAAWRTYRQMTQSEAAAQAGITQAALSQIEKSRNPQRKTRELFAKIYQCQPEQLAE